MKAVKCVVNYLMDDGFTGCEKSFNSIKQAKDFCKNNGIKEYTLTRDPHRHLSFKDIDNLAKEIKNFLVKYGLASDVFIYYNNKREESIIDKDGKYSWMLTENVDPHKYFKYAAYDHILSMSFEGEFYGVVNGDYGRTYLNKFHDILNKYNLYYELGNYWNLTLVSYESRMTVDYTYYDREPEPISLYYRNIDNIEKPLADIMEKWYQLSLVVGDIGSCVIGAGFNFIYHGQKYWMSECSPYQGSISWEVSREEIERMLKEIGATQINYNWGIMD